MELKFVDLLFKLQFFRPLQLVLLLLLELIEFDAHFLFERLPPAILSALLGLDRL